MTANRSLDEFSEAAEGEPPAASGDPPQDGAVSGAVVEESESEPAVEAENEAPPPLVSTYVWSPEGGPCAACGGTVEARWREGDDLVCPDCKSW